MAEVATAPKPLKRPLGDENAEDAPDAAKKPRAAAPAEAPTVELAKEVKQAAQKFLVVANKHAPGWEAQEGENAAELVERVADGEKKGQGVALIMKPVVAKLDKNYQKKWNKTKLRNAIKRALANVSAAAFVVAGAPPKKKEEEGYVEGTVDIKKVDGDEWRRYNNPTKLSKDTGFLGESGPSLQQIQEMLKRLSDPKSKYAEQRGFEVRYVTPATRHATATNKVVRGFHAEDKVPRKPRARERHATAVAVAEERRRPRSRTRPRTRRSGRSTT